MLFESVFAGWLPAGETLIGIWVLALWCACGHAFGALLGLRQWRWRAVVVGGFFVLGNTTPDQPFLFLGGRLGALTDASWAVLLLLVVSILGVVGGVWRPSLHRLLPSLSGLFLAVLSIGYHVVIMNGLDASQRRFEEARLVDLLQEGVDIAPLCATGYIRCGVGDPPEFNSFFSKDYSDHLAYGLPGSRDGVVSGSKGGPTAPETYVWAAVRQEGKVVWVYKSWAQETEASTLAFGLMLVVSAAVWVPAPVLVEVLHLRARRRRLREQQGIKAHL